MSVSGHPDNSDTPNNLIPFPGSTNSNQLNLFGNASESPAKFFPYSAPDAIVSFDELSAREFPSVKIVLSPRLKSSWYVEWRRITGTCQITLPQVLELAPENVKRDVFAWAGLMRKPKRRWTAEDKTARHALEKSIRSFMGTPNSDMRSKSLSPLQQKILKKSGNKKSPRRKKLVTQGVRHDLKDIFSAINEEYFQGRLVSDITWSSRIGGLSTHFADKDENANERHLITISQGYNAKNVSREILGGVVYHECLHIDIPPVVRGGRRIVHGSEFRKREKLYRHYSDWIYFHNYKLAGNLRTLRWRRSMGKLTDWLGL